MAGVGSGVSSQAVPNFYRALSKTGFPAICFHTYSPFVFPHYEQYINLSSFKSKKVKIVAISAIGTRWLPNIQICLGELHKVCLVILISFAACF